jgi:acyl-CoA dehydrogenase
VLDRERGYPTEFVNALTQAGFLAGLIPEEYGGSGLTTGTAAAIMEENHASGCNGAACHAQMYTMGTILRHGNAEKARYLPNIASGKIRLQAFGVTEPTSGADTLSPRTTAIRDGDHYVVNGQKIWTSRIEHSDLHLREFVAQRHAQLEFQIFAHSAVPSREGEAERIGPQSIGR